MNKLMNLSEKKRFSDVLSSLNHEIRNVVLWRFSDVNEKSIGQIRTEFNEFYCSFGIPKTEKNYIFKYFLDTFEPMGYAKQTNPIISGYVDSWKLTDFGNNFGKVLAAHSIRTSSDFGFSLLEVLGRTNGKGSVTAPYNTGRTFLYLKKENKPVRMVDVAKNLNVNSSVITKSMERFKVAGLVDYKSVNSDVRTERIFSWRSGNVEDCLPVDRATTVVNHVASIILESSYGLTPRQIRQRVIDRYQKEYTEKQITRVACGLEYQKRVYGKGKFKIGTKQSEITLTDKGRRFIDNFVLPIKEACKSGIVNGEFENTLQYYDNAQNVIRDSVRSMEFCIKDNPHFKLIDGEQSDKEVLSVLSKGPIRPKELFKVLGRNVNRSLERLSSSGSIIKYRDGNAVFYKTV